MASLSVQVSHVQTGQRKISQTKAKYQAQDPDPGTIATNESDTNADTCCLGKNFLVQSYTNRTVDVYSYNTSTAPITDVPIVTGVTAWDCPSTGNAYILVFNESLYYGNKLDHTLINPNQVRHHGNKYWDNPYDRRHDLCIDIDRGPVIPLTLCGTKVSFDSRVPTKQELDTCEHIELTSSIPWDPHVVKLGEMNAPRHQDDYIPDSDELIKSITPSLIMLKEMSTRHIQANSYIDLTPEDIPSRRSFISNDRHKRLTAESISELWGIGKSRSMATIDATTQNGTRSAILPLSRRYRADRRYNLRRLEGEFSTDSLYAEVKSILGNKYAQLYSMRNGFTAIYPLENLSGDSIGYTLKDFSHDFGIPGKLKLDGFSSQVGKRTLMMKTIRENRIEYHISEPYNPNQTPAEGAIREVKKRWYRIMMKKGVPKRLWDFGLVWISETGNLTVSSSRYANGRTPLEVVTGETPDISEYTDFGFYDRIWYRSNGGISEPMIGRWLGVSHKVGPLMSYWILPESGIPISCITVQRITNTELATDEVKTKIDIYDMKILQKMDANNIDNGREMGQQPAWNRLSLDDEDNDFIEEFNRVISDSSVPDAEDYSPDTFDGYLSMQIGIPRGSDNELHYAKVKKRAVDEDGRPVGKSSNNPLTDTRQYEVEFEDGSIEVLAANIIAENVLAQVDEEGHRQMMMREIIDHRVDTSQAIPKEKGEYTNSHGTKTKVRTTKGWELCIEWRDGSTDWVSLKDIKQSYPVEAAMYARENLIHEEPAFAWWVPYTLKKQKRILSKLKSKYWQRTHKYGIELPKTVEEAYAIDKKNGNTLWADAINMEMKRIRDAFKLYQGNPEELIGYQEITTHFIFDIKLGENFRRKARLVADGHKTKTPSHVTYSSVVSRDSVRICLLAAALNDLDILSADIENAYLTAPCAEKIWTRGGPEFGSDAGQPFLVISALYGLKSSGAAFRSFLALKLDEIGFKSTLADPDVWIRPAVKPDGEEYYQYMLVYVDDLLCVAHDASTPLREIMADFKFKKDAIEPPEIYLGARLQKKDLNGKGIWTMSSYDYTKAIISNLEERLKKTNKNAKLLSKGVKTPMASSYVPEFDMSDELEGDDITMFQELIGELRWAIEIGRVDIHTEVSILSAYQASPRRGHLEQVIHIYAYLKKYKKLTLYFDPRVPELGDISTFDSHTSEIFKEQYRDAEEQVPSNMPPPRGRMVNTTAYVDASHAANKMTRRSHTGFIIFVNRAPIIWYSKRQNTVESSTFSSEFIALKTCMESIVALRYKLRMFGIPFEDPTQILCDNQSVVDNSSRIESKLNKKHNAIAYHAVRWAVAASTIIVGKINGELNLADAMTKRLTALRREFLFGGWTY